MASVNILIINKAVSANVYNISTTICIMMLKHLWCKGRCLNYYLKKTVIRGFKGPLNLL